MDNTTLQDIVEELNNRDTLRPDDIPNLDLYMDQIMTLFDEHLKDYKRNENDKLITKTMINNYSKEGILKPIKGKKYTKEHIIQMLVIYSLKNTITIQEIKKVLDPLHQDNIEIEPIYQKHLDTIEPVITKMSEEFLQSASQLNETDNKDLLSILLMTCSISSYFQTLSQKILDQFYEEEDK